MHAGRQYSLKEFLIWTRRDSYWLLAIATLPTALFMALGWKWFALPWVPVALVGTAAAFIVGFRNNATYARAWESRVIYGAIVNTSRSWGMVVCDLVRPGSTFSETQAAAARTELVHRHIAWLTALRYQLRQPRTWESMQQAHNAEYKGKYFTVEEHVGDLGAELAKLLSEADRAHVLGKSNRATQLLALQGAQVTALYEGGVFEANHRVLLERLLIDLFDHQGKAERIKNYPYPRQFATINKFFTRIFIWLAPLGMLGEFAKLGPWQGWLTLPTAFLIGWIFNAMERVGESTENPFEGNANDTPITTMSRTIEIDLREMLGEADIPKPIPAQHNIQL